MYANCYPKKFCNKFIFKRLAQILNKKQYKNSDNNDNSEQSVLPQYISLPYQKPLINNIEEICKNNKLKVAYKAKNKLSSIIKKDKDSLDRNLQTNVKYTM